LRLRVVRLTIEVCVMVGAVVSIAIYIKLAP